MPNSKAIQNKHRFNNRTLVKNYKQLKVTSMKKLLFLALVLPLLFASCSDVEDDFEYKSSIVGKWQITHIESQGSYINITEYPYNTVYKPTYATFNSNGTYSGSGFFGTGSGTYIGKGKTLTTYIDGKEYLKYDVLSLTGNVCELKMYETGSESSIKIKCKKQ